MKYLKKAFEIACNNPHSKELKSVHGAVLVSSGRVLSTGINKPKTNQLIETYAHHAESTIHAECDAILKVRKKTNLRGAKIYVARMRKTDRKPGYSKPCLMCQKIINRYGIKKVFYTEADGTYNMMRLF